MDAHLHAHEHAHPYLQMQMHAYPLSHPYAYQHARSILPPASTSTAMHMHVGTNGIVCRTPLEARARRQPRTPARVPPSWYGPDRLDTFLPVETDPEKVYAAQFTLGDARHALIAANWNEDKKLMKRRIRKLHERTLAGFPSRALEPVHGPGPVPLVIPVPPRQMVNKRSRIDMHEEGEGGAVDVTQGSDGRGQRREVWGEYELVWNEETNRVVPVKRARLGESSQSGQGEGEGGEAVEVAMFALPRATESRERKRGRGDGSRNEGREGETRRRKRARAESREGEDAETGGATGQMGGGGLSEANLAGAAAEAAIEVNGGMLIRSTETAISSSHARTQEEPATPLVKETLVELVKRVRDGHDMGYKPSPLSGPSYQEGRDAQSEEDIEEGGVNAGEAHQVEMSKRAMASCVLRARTGPPPTLPMRKRRHCARADEGCPHDGVPQSNRKRTRWTSRFEATPLPFASAIESTAALSGSGFWEGNEALVAETAIRCVGLGQTSAETARTVAKAFFQQTGRAGKTLAEVKELEHAAKMNATLGHATLREFLEGKRRVVEMATRAEEEARRRENGERRVGGDERREAEGKVRQQEREDAEWAEVMGKAAGEWDGVADEVWGTLSPSQMDRLAWEDAEAQRQLGMWAEYEHLTMAAVRADVATSAPDAYAQEGENEAEGWDELVGHCLSAVFPLARELRDAETVRGLGY